jgi:hypothetical protein
MDALWGARSHLQALVVGLDFHQTDPVILRRFEAFVRVLRVDGVFHPKTYLFRKGSSFTCILGSSNLTGGGFGANTEANLIVRGRISDPLFHETKTHIEDLRRRARRLTEPEVADYTRQHRRLRWLRQRLAHFKPSKRAAHRAHLQAQREAHGQKPPEDLQMSWPMFQKRVLAQELDKRRYLRVRVTPGESSFLAVSGQIRRLFRQKRSLVQMTRDERRQVGGLHEDYLYFGSMRGAGAFQNILLENPARLDRALKAIPLRGEITRRNFLAFFRRLPPSGIGIATATRLLAMKRPDRLLCVDVRNTPELARAFGVTRASLQTFEGYWKLLNRVWICPWFRARRPRTGLGADLWDSRVAILDAFYYEP